MRRLIMIFLTLLSIAQIAGCATVSEVKAPCDDHGRYCGQKIRINE